MVLLLGLAGKEALSHQRTYSPVEKRELQTRPEISITKVLDGRFQKKYESYLRDQFPGRDHWVSFQTDMELFMGKNEIHNVYIGKNHYLLEHYTEKEFDPQQISKNLQALEKFVGKAKQNADVHVMMVPTSRGYSGKNFRHLPLIIRSRSFMMHCSRNWKKRMY